MRGEMATGAQTRVPAGACRVALGSLVSSQADLLLIVCLFEIHAEVLPEIRHLCANKNTPGQGQLGSTHEEKSRAGDRTSLGKMNTCASSITSS